MLGFFRVYLSCLNFLGGGLRFIEGWFRVDLYCAFWGLSQAWEATRQEKAKKQNSGEAEKKRRMKAKGGKSKKGKKQRRRTAEKQRSRETEKKMPKTEKEKNYPTKKTPHWKMPTTQGIQHNHNGFPVSIPCSVVVENVCGQDLWYGSTVRCTLLLARLDRHARHILAPSGGFHK